MNKVLVGLFVIAGLLPAIPSQAENYGLPKEQYKAQKEKIEQDYKASEKRCDSLSGNSKAICEKEVKGDEKIAKAQLEAAFKDSPENRYKARMAKVDAAYAVGKEKCDDLAGNMKDVCVKETKAIHESGKADAKIDKAVGKENKKSAENYVDAQKKVDKVQQNAMEDKMDANYKVALERCDSLAGAAKDKCAADAKTKYRK